MWSILMSFKILIFFSFGDKHQFLIFYYYESLKNYVEGARGVLPGHAFVWSIIFHGCFLNIRMVHSKILQTCISLLFFIISSSMFNLWIVILVPSIVPFQKLSKCINGHFYVSGTASCFILASMIIIPVFSFSSAIRGNIRSAKKQRCSRNAGLLSALLWKLHSRLEKCWWSWSVVILGSVYSFSFALSW